MADRRLRSPSDTSSVRGYESLRPADARARGGFVLVAVLWAVVAMSALALVTMMSADDAVTVARNRIALERAEWLAESCAARARARLDAPSPGNAADRDGSDEGTWSPMEGLASERLVDGAWCSAALVPSVAIDDLAGSTDEELRLLFVTLSVAPTTADSLVDALRDWSDADDVPRARGAEREWYTAMNRPPPSNTAITEMPELLAVRGAAQLPRSSRLLLERLVSLGARGTSGAVDSRSRPALLVVRAGSGTPTVSVILELTLVPTGGRHAVVQRRTWVE